MKIYDGQEWSDSILITEGMPGSDYNKVIIDNLNRVFVFWATNGSYDYYRIYQNGVWSEIMEPYFNVLPDLYYLYYQESDTNNNMHWIGYTTEYMGTGEYAHAYFIYNNEENTWSEPLNLTLAPALIGNDITLNNYNLPAIAIREKTIDTASYDATLYLNNNGLQWSVPELIVEDPENQQIAIDQHNYVHVVNREKTVLGYQVVHYKKYNNEWIGYIIDSTPNFCNPTKLLFYNNQLYLLYFRDSIPGYPDVNIMLAKYDLTTSIKNNPIYISTLTVYPNPTSGQIKISFELTEPEYVNMLIFDFSGRHVKTLINRKMQKGKHLTNWDGKNENGLIVKSGMYLCRLYCKRNVITKSIEIIK